MLAGGRKTGIQKSIWRGAILLFLPKGYTTEVVTGNSGFFLVATVCCISWNKIGKQSTGNEKKG